MKIAVLGSGLIGSVIVEDLARETGFRVTAVDRNREALMRLERKVGVTTSQADLRDAEVVRAVAQEHELLVCAVPGSLGFATLRSVIEAGRDVVDISFFPEDAFALDQLARERGVTAVVDCGVAPGMCNILAGHVSSLLEEVERYSCYVGGLPAVRRWPYQYKTVFSPDDVIEEYTRPARLREGGREVVRPALSGLELIDLPGVGTLEAFNTDGLRSLLRTLRAPFMCEKTLRYPGHAELMRVFRESGFFSSEPLRFGECSLRPRELTSELLFREWRMSVGEEDLTVMRVVVEGRREGKAVRYRFDLCDRFDPETGTTAMARTTGFTCAIVVRLLAGGRFRRRGVCPPEWIGGEAACYRTLLSGYARRGIVLEESVTER